MSPRWRVTNSGSSPLARGLPRDSSGRRDGLGIIPARAGFTTGTPRRLSARTDHPRSRGVYVKSSGGALTAFGSSPLARGLQVGTGDDGIQTGIIPARAGFTSPDPAVGGPAADHPRSRGVYRPWPWPGALASGSSPLARGLPHHHLRLRHPQRIIPARAGFTDPEPGVLLRPPDHPRSRGVYTRAACFRTRRPGSSPLARGLLSAAAQRVENWRIIPARAGFTAHNPGRPPSTTDHPRSRGVYIGRVPGPVRARGSSPLARGLPGRGEGHDHG